MKNLFKKFFCRIGWHSLNGYDSVGFIDNDPLKFQKKAKCKWCGYEGLLDSSGNLF